MAQWGRWSQATIAGRLTSRPTRFSATSKVVGGDEGAGTKSGSALGEHERVLPLLAGARSRFLEHRAGDPELAMPLATEPGAVEQPKVNFLGQHPPVALEPVT